MNESLLVHRLRNTLRELTQLVADRARAESETEAVFRSQTEAAEKTIQEARHRITSLFEADKEAAERENQEARQRIAKQLEAEQAAAEQEFAESWKSLAERFEAESEKNERKFQEARWTLAAVFEASKNGSEAPVREVQLKVAAGAQRIQGIHQEARKTLQTLGQPRIKVSVVRPTGEPASNPFEDIQESLTDADTQLGELKELRWPRWVKGKRLAGIFVLLAAALVYPSAWVTTLLLEDPSASGWTHGFVAGGAAAIGIAAAVCAWLYFGARARVRGVYKPLCQALYDAEASRKRCQELAESSSQRQVLQLTESQQRHVEELRRTDAKYRRRLDNMKLKRGEEQRQAEERRRLRIDTGKQRHDDEMRQLDEEHQRRQTEIRTRFETDTREAGDAYARQIQESKARHDQAWATLAGNWHQGMSRVGSVVAETNAEINKWFPDWSDPCWNAWQPGAGVPPSIRFGKVDVRLDQFPKGIPDDPRLRDGVPLEFSPPALLPFPQSSSLVLKASDVGRIQAIEVLENLMLRFLTALPPGKVRFTIIDPVGLGENFAAFMHLADFDEALVASRIWTEPPHIEQRLADLTAHMEMVIQKYLRNQYDSIEDYNARAGEVAEPYRVLVVANFPVNFTSEAARRLISIASSGASCGVFTLISVDTKQPLPQGFDLADLERPCLNLAWQDGRFLWRDGDFGNFPLHVDSPPAADFCTCVLHVVGEKAKEAKRVEVPFGFIAPPRERWWGTDSRLAIDVPLGRVGATKRQHVRLGQGTLQHMLIAGKTGSGKSTLFHALVTNLSLLYSPEEVQLYLVDFKKGVEFKTYATHELPHARVVAIESEREFGLSVLHQLDAELKRRGERFRELGAQDLKACRAADPHQPYPRILLIVDEFQEFFVEDDKLAQEAALVLDRLVRQGRAFGIHVVLGSQTIGGAYTLARSTIDQMAIRIALQCSEADAHLILSEDNSAARLLSRPGEAIYNDANGLVEGNNPFQVCWLPDDEREQYLQEVQELARKRNLVPTVPQIVFEGNAPADVTKNLLLRRVLEERGAGALRSSGAGAYAWLGDAIAIKDPTVAIFRPESGSNLLILGQDDAAGLGILATALVSLAAQEEAARFYALDGGPPDSPNVGLFNRMAGVVPQTVRVASWRDTAAIIGELAAEVDRRQQANELDAPPTYLLIYGLQRFRELRRQEDDFGFSRGGDAAVSPEKQFVTILREGPAFGVHTLVWCDSLNNLHRTFDRHTLREFDMRVLFQMNAADSSNLIDSPLASKLGLHRALFYHEEQGRLEKFRPYGVPAGDWLVWVREQLQGSGGQPVTVAPAQRGVV